MPLSPFQGGGLQRAEDHSLCASCSAVVSTSTLTRVFPSSANTSTQTNNRKTIPPQAVLDALTELEFSQFLPRVEAELVKFEDVQKKKRTDYRNKLKDEEIKKKANGDESVEAGEGATEHARNATNGGGGDGDQDTEMALRPAVEREDHDGQRAAKRARFGSEEGGVALSNGGSGMNGHRRVSDGSNGGENDQDTFEDAAEEQDDVAEEEEDDDGRDDEADEEEENNEEEEDEEDDDEDEYPDEGRRLSSIEADNDANVTGDARMAGMDSADEMQDSD